MSCISFSAIWILLHGGFQGGADALEHEIKGGKTTHRLVCHLLGDLLEDAQHRAFANRAVLSLEGIVLRK